jgi:N-acetylmuramoyl-L-alanine amidase
MRRLPIVGVIILSALFICQGNSSGAERLSKKLGLKVKTIYLDPAYGGREDGPQFSKGKQGKNITLNIAQTMQSILETKGFAVYLSRSDDSSVPPETRTFQAISKGSALYIGIKTTVAKQDCISIFTGPKPIKTHQPVNERTSDSSNGLSEILSALAADDKHEESAALAGTVAKKLSEADLLGCIHLQHSFDYALINTPMPALIIDFNASHTPKKQPYISNTTFNNAVAEILSDAIKEYADDRASKMNP